MTPTFRIWNKQNKRVVENGTSLHAFSQWVMDVETGDLYDAIGAIDSKVDSASRYLDPAPDYYLKGTKIIKEPQYVLQQFTGYTTEDGTKIYEGDVVRFVYHVGDFAWEYMAEGEKDYQMGMDGRTFTGLISRNIITPTNLELRCPLSMENEPKKGMHKKWSAAKVIEWIKNNAPTIFFPVSYAKNCKEVIGNELESD
jgi:uncharacterized phage protein (TIGR01671 family)